MAYKVPTLDEMLGFLVAQFKALLPTRNVGSRKLFNWKLLKTFAGGVTDVHANVTTGLRDVMPDSARREGLDRWIGIIAPGGSKLRKGATPARKANAGRVQGANGSTVAIGDQLIHRASGLLFQINEAATVPVAEFIDVDIAAIDTGAATRLEKGEVLEFLNPPAGIQMRVELQLALDEDGHDQEQDGAARNRLLAAMGEPKAGGNQADYVAWALAQTGISAAFCYPNRAGIGTVDVAALHEGSGSARILLPGEVTDLLAKLKELAPTQLSGTGGALRVLTAIAETANVELTITPDGQSQYAFDWDDSVPPVVASWEAGAVPRKLTFTLPRPATMNAGDRLVLKGVASSQDGKPYKIESLSGADAVILEKAPPVAPAATDIAYAAGPLTDIVRDAILAHINGEVLYAGQDRPLPASIAEAEASTFELKPLVEGIGTANPAGIYGTWRGGLLRGTLQTIAMYTRGVRNQNVITPAADLEATDYAFPNDAQIGLLVPGFVLVRKG